MGGKDSYTRTYSQERCAPSYSLSGGASDIDIPFYLRKRTVYPIPIPEQRHGGKGRRGIKTPSTEDVASSSSVTVDDKGDFATCFGAVGPERG